MAKLYNLARMTSATTGTGTIALGSAVSGYLSFAGAGVSDGETVRYGIADGSNSEVGTGTYTASGTTLTRNVETSTNGNAAISLSGSAQVYITPTKGDFLNVSAPQGRLTLTTVTPVLNATVSGATIVYYTPSDAGQLVPLYDGTSFNMVDTGGELSQATTDTTKSPAAVASNKLYDKFVWTDAGTMRATRGPAWSSDTSRGTGAGTSELVRQNGLLLNKNAITNGPAALRGTYVGTIRSNGSSQIDWILGGAASGGTAGSLGVWNCYNRVNVAATAYDTANHTYGTSTWRQFNASSGNQVSFVRGLDEDVINVTSGCFISLSAANFGLFGIGLDSTTATTGAVAEFGGVTNLDAAGIGVLATQPGIGWHYVASLEYAIGSTAFYGDNFGHGHHLTYRGRH